MFMVIDNSELDKIDNFILSQKEKEKTIPESQLFLSKEVYFYQISIPE